MELYLIRHAQADNWAQGGDDERKLTQKGQLQAQGLGQWMRKLNIQPELVICSPVKRAQQTAEWACKAGGYSKPLVQNWLQCGMEPNQAFQEMKAFSEFNAVALVGHQPDLSAWIEAMLGARSGSLRIRKACFCHLSWHPQTSLAELEALVPWQLMTS